MSTDRCEVIDFLYIFRSNDPPKKAPVNQVAVDLSGLNTAIKLQPKPSIEADNPFREEMLRQDQAQNITPEPPPRVAPRRVANSAPTQPLTPKPRQIPHTNRQSGLVENFSL